MNDYTEVQHGLECLSSAYRGEKGQKLKKALNEIFEGITDEIASSFDSWAGHFQNDTYVTCVSEHDESEDTLGRLSMWRAYGERTGVALVLNNTAFLGPSGSLKLYSSPVSYLDDVQFGDRLEELANQVESNQELIRSIGRDWVIHYVFTAFRFAAVCTKHPGFKEEREWRVVYCPKLEKSEHLIKEIHAIRGTPQPICTIPLRNLPDEGIVGLCIPELVNRIIIGPSDYASAVYEAFNELLSSAGVEDPQSRVCVSTIPLR